MIKKMIVVIFIMCTGCSTVADLTIQSVAGAVGGALGNMADRRMEKALGNNAEELKNATRRLVQTAINPREAIAYAQTGVTKLVENRIRTSLTILTLPTSGFQLLTRA